MRRKPKSWAVIALCIAVLACTSQRATVAVSSALPHEPFLVAETYSYSYDINMQRQVLDVLLPGRTQWRHIGLANAIYFIFRDEEGYGYEAWHVIVNPGEAPTWIVLGMNPDRVTSGMTFTFEGEDGSVAWYEVVTTMSPYGQMVPTDPK